MLDALGKLVTDVFVSNVSDMIPVYFWGSITIHAPLNEEIASIGA
ncbi:hypothetical protein [Bifidobacterium apri]|nr:hypothetical protein [Bifidobacterium apri]